MPYIDADFVKVWREPDTGSRTAFYLYFGDEVLIEDDPALPAGWAKVTALDRATESRELIRGFVRQGITLREDAILKASMVDVQQGDGMVIETPSGKIILIDGGDNKLFARHVAARFRARRSTETDPLPVDAIIVTHGDADHFSGLCELMKSETLEGPREHKRVFIYPKCILHNGLVKGPSALSTKRQLGATLDLDGNTYITDLYEDIRDAPESAQNRPFKQWIEAIEHWGTRGPITIRRAGTDKDLAEVFDFLSDDDIEVELFTPEVEDVTDASGTGFKSLKFLKNPPKTALLHEIELDGSGGLSAGHTINGHSISFRLTFGNVRFLFTGDLNKDMLAHLDAKFSRYDLEAEILKTPHHGSADFDLAFFKKVRPIVSLVSSGDENARKEYIHPRATLMNALGAASRYDTGVLLTTELTAFFNYRDACYTRTELKRFFDQSTQETFTRQELERMFTGEAEGPSGGEPWFFSGFERTQFGLIEIRTDGHRVLVFTHSGRNELFEAYRFRVTKSRNGRHMVEFDHDVVIEGR